VVTGSVAFDYLMRFPGRFVEHLIPDQMERLSVSFLVDEMRRVPGGCGPNIAYGLALLGETPVLLAAAGHDAREYRDQLEREGVDVSGMVLHDDLFTASFFVSTDLDQNQLASFYTGAMARARHLPLSAAPAAPGLVVISPNDPEAMSLYAGEARRRRLRAIYDPSQQVARLSARELEEGIAGAWMLIVNDYELGILTQKTGRSAAELESVLPVLVVTHGARGSTIIAREGEGHARHAIPPASVEGVARDPTGVVDAYRAGLVRAWRLGLPWEVAGRMGSVAAVFALEAPGPQPPRYTPRRFRERYERNYGQEHALDALADS